ncbi:transglycosylase SLT domain-containing protein [Methylorubrum rhodesianum]|jgi:Transglycosylase SLT domain|uniref:lytic transglycosylase domain-containing protein n=1 Tax=Methylobacteriaceae TaxID=119045 RepID=UPI001F12D78E|nr:lytic transglycosylase domain-containing protein [Methylobacterium organophilum]UMY20324.1 lytic transglycosylase domain-containing protein [Methylobacterium organophilum]
MRKLPAFCVIVAATAAYASNCPSGDAMLKNNTPLNQLCPNGFTSKSGGSIENAMANQKDNVAMVYASAQNTGVPTDLALAVSYHESVGFNSCAGSDTGVKGPMQLTQRTARSLGFDRDINQQNINGGMAVLKRAYDKCGYNYTCLSANYNGSPRPGEQAGWARGVEAATNKFKNNPKLLASACNESTTANCNPNDAGNPNLPGSGTAVAQNPTKGGDAASAGSGAQASASPADLSSPAEHPPTRDMASIILPVGAAALEPREIPEGIALPQNTL